VNRKRTTAEERRLARDVLAQWNEATGQTLSAVGHLERIIRRDREHPLAVDEHRHVIDMLLAGKRWWDGPPSPNLIYGNDTAYERALTRAAQAPPVQNAEVIAQSVIDAARARRTA